MCRGAARLTSPEAAVFHETPALPDPGVVESLFGERSDLAYRYGELLTGRGIERGLIGPREAPRIWTRHLLNCAVVAPLLPPHARVCDVGSGAGLPGVVLALARPDASVTLLEPLLRRSTFLTEVVADLGLPNAVVRRGRAENLVGREPFDVVTARAVAPLPVLVSEALPLVRRGGELVAWKGETASAEVDAAREALRRAAAGSVTIETHGTGVVEPPTTVVRIVSSRTIVRGERGSR